MEKQAWQNKEYHQLGRAATNRMKAATRREEPDRHHFLLREAVKATGVKILGFEYELGPATRPGWYDVAIEYRGKIALVGVIHEDNRAKNARYYRQTLAKELEIPYLEVESLNQTDMQARIEHWLLTMTSRPWRFVEHFDPTKKLIKPKRSQPSPH